MNLKVKVLILFGGTSVFYLSVATTRNDYNATSVDWTISSAIKTKLTQTCLSVVMSTFQRIG